MVYCGSWLPHFIFPVLNVNLTRILLDSGARSAIYSVEKWTVDKGQGREVQFGNIWRWIFTLTNAFMARRRQIYLSYTIHVSNTKIYYTKLRPFSLLEITVIV
jgi:hypothetical protein